MATESLHIPENKLEEVISVIRAGIEITEISSETKENLLKWCEDEEDYINNMKE